MAVYVIRPEKGREGEKEDETFAKFGGGAAVGKHRRGFSAGASFGDEVADLAQPGRRESRGEVASGK